MKGGGVLLVKDGTSTSFTRVRSEKVLRNSSGGEIALVTTYMGVQIVTAACILGSGLASSNFVVMTS
jgi:hypothetical protein